MGLIFICMNWLPHFIHIDTDQLMNCTQHWHSQYQDESSGDLHTTLTLIYGIYQLNN